MCLARYFAPFVLALAGCSDDGTNTAAPTGSPTESPTGSPTGEATDATSDTSPTSTSGDPTTSAATSAPEEGAPVFLSLQTNVGKLTAGQEVIVTAVLTDPDGLDDIAGGTLSSPDGKIGYGPFTAAGQQGTYSITLSWAAIHQAEPIQFEAMDLPRSFKADFYDQAAHKVAQNVEISLFCAENSACDGVCTDIMSDGDHCGSCAKACESGCEAGGCAPKRSDCFTPEDGFDSCAVICQSIGETCAAAQCNGATTRYYGTLQNCIDNENAIEGPDPCEEIQDWAKPAIRCCCTDST